MINSLYSGQTHPTFTRESLYIYIIDIKTTPTTTSREPNWPLFFEGRTSPPKQPAELPIKTATVIWLLGSDPSHDRPPRPGSRWNAHPPKRPGRLKRFCIKCRGSIRPFGDIGCCWENPFPLIMAFPWKIGSLVSFHDSGSETHIFHDYKG